MPDTSGIENSRPKIEHSGSLIAAINTRRGVGIPAEKIHAVFEPFLQLATKFSSRQDGSGLGLTISRQFTRGKHGDLVVACGITDGASFRLTLPLAQPPAWRRLREPGLLVLSAPDVLLQALDERLQIRWCGRAFGGK